MMVLSDIRAVVANYVAAITAGFIVGAGLSLVGYVVAWALRLIRGRSN